MGRRPPPGGGRKISTHFLNSLNFRKSLTGIKWLFHRIFHFLLALKICRPLKIFWPSKCRLLECTVRGGSPLPRPFLRRYNEMFYFGCIQLLYHFASLGKPVAIVKNGVHDHGRDHEIVLVECVDMQLGFSWDVAFRRYWWGPFCSSRTDISIFFKVNLKLYATKVPHKGFADSFLNIGLPPYLEPTLKLIGLFLFLAQQSGTLFHWLFDLPLNRVLSYLGLKHIFSTLHYQHIVGLTAFR